MMNYYRILGISCSATAEEIKAAYRKRAKETHPDVNRDADPDAFKELLVSYETLSDPETRAAYHAEYEDHAKQLGYIVCPHCFAMLRVRRFSAGEKPRCGECKTRLQLTPDQRDARYQEAFATQLGELIETVGAEGGALAKDAVRAAADRIRRKFGLTRG